MKHIRTYKTQQNQCFTLRKFTALINSITKTENINMIVDIPILVEIFLKLYH